MPLWIRNVFNILNLFELWLCVCLVYFVLIYPADNSKEVLICHEKGWSRSVLVYALHSLEYVIGLTRFRVFVPNMYVCMSRYSKLIFAFYLNFFFLFTMVYRSLHCIKLQFFCSKTCFICLKNLCLNLRDNYKKLVSKQMFMLIERICE